MPDMMVPVHNFQFDMEDHAIGFIWSVGVLFPEFVAQGGKLLFFGGGVTGFDHLEDLAPRFGPAIQSERSTDKSLELELGSEAVFGGKRNRIPVGIGLEDLFPNGKLNRIWAERFPWFVVGRFTATIDPARRGFQGAQNTKGRPAELE